MKVLKIIALLLLGIMLGVAGAVFSGAGRLWWYANKTTARQPLPVAPAIPDAIADLKDRLDLYAKRADDLERLLSLLVTVSTVYAIALGINAYAQVKESATKIKDLEDSLTREADTTKNEVLRLFPLFDGIEYQMIKTMSELLELLPRLDIAQKKFDDLKPEEKQAVMYYEKSISATELFNMRSFKDQRSGIFHVLGNFYALKYEKDKKDADSLQRSLYYFRKAIDVDPKSVEALNDRGYVALVIYETKNLTEALRYFSESLAADHEQQRARYNIAWIHKHQGNYAESVRLITEALSKIKWQKAPDKARIADLHYNRACSRARLEAGKPVANRDFNAVLDDLEKVLKNDSADWGNLLNDFRDDTQPNGELFDAVNSDPRGKEIFSKFFGTH
jgi:tetratricopeptide (TPR) repeat protein